VSAPATKEISDWVEKLGMSEYAQERPLGEPNMQIIDAQVHAYERNHPGRPWIGHLQGAAIGNGRSDGSRDGTSARLGHLKAFKSF
jgi:hypothetical protein